MFRKRTLLVVGAGASFEVGLPLGIKLTTQIASGVSFNDNRWGNEPIGGSEDIYRALRHRADASDFNKCLFACRDMSKSLVHADSIDAYMNDFRDDKHIQFCGKLAIAHYISVAEFYSTLSVDKTNIYNTIAQEKLSNTWYDVFFRILKEGIDNRTASNIFSNVSIICFNYDRCIEQYLYYSLRDYYRLNSQSSIDLLHTLNILRPYGSIGKFEADSTSGHSNFGVQLQGPDLVERSKQLRTIFDRQTEKQYIDRIQAEIEKAEQIIFLGFGFHPLNVELMQSPNPSRTSLVLATAKGIPTPGINILKERVHKIISGKPKSKTGSLKLDQLNVLQEVTCRQILENYRLVISAD